MKTIKTKLTVFLINFVFLLLSNSVLAAPGYDYINLSLYLKDSKVGSTNYLELILQNKGYGNTKIGAVHDFKQSFGVASHFDVYIQNRFRELLLMTKDKNVYNAIRTNHCIQDNSTGTCPDVYFRDSTF